MATSRAERGIARHVSVEQASCLSHLIDGLEARPTGATLYDASILIGRNTKTLKNYDVPSSKHHTAWYKKQV